MVLLERVFKKYIVKMSILGTLKVLLVGVTKCYLQEREKTLRLGYFGGCNKMLLPERAFHKDTVKISIL